MPAPTISTSKCSAAGVRRAVSSIWAPFPLTRRTSTPVTTVRRVYSRPPSQTIGRMSSLTPSVRPRRRRPQGASGRVGQGRRQTQGNGETTVPLLLGSDGNLVFGQREKRGVVSPCSRGRRRRSNHGTSRRTGGSDHGRRGRDRSCDRTSLPP